MYMIGIVLSEKKEIKKNNNNNWQKHTNVKKNMFF